MISPQNAVQAPGVNCFQCQGCAEVKPDVSGRVEGKTYKQVTLQGLCDVAVIADISPNFHHPLSIVNNSKENASILTAWENTGIP